MINRRRFLAISAAASTLPGMSLAEPVTTWQGRALGARTTLRLAHPNAKAISAQVAAEISRLEDIFSLYRADSALSRLNADGTLRQPPFELLECLSLAGAVHSASGGRFDPSIQPLWTSYAAASATGQLPDEDALNSARAQTGWERISFDAHAVTLDAGMALTLNGIAQGYIADRITELLSDAGLTNILIDTGEFRALGTHPDGTAWPVKLTAGGMVPLATRALATSAPLGTTFDAGAKLGHILDPRTGRPAPSAWREISVSAKTAALADALSTAACLFDSRADIDVCIAKFQGVTLEAAVAA